MPGRSAAGAGRLSGGGPVQRAGTTTTRAQRLRADAACNYERIVIAAGVAFEVDGPAVTLEEVARRAGVGVATVCRGFRERDQLVRAVFEHLVTTQIEPVSAL